jgi:hypothetical protein
MDPRIIGLSSYGIPAPFSSHVYRFWSLLIGLTSQDLASNAADILTTAESKSKSKIILTYQFEDRQRE